LHREDIRHLRRVGAMPPLGGVNLSDSEVIALAAYVRAIDHRKKG
jgi:hypothetical protein